MNNIFLSQFNFTSITHTQLLIITISILKTTRGLKKLTLILFLFLIYFEVAGRTYGEEPVMKYIGPLLAFEQ